MNVSITLSAPDPNRPLPPPDERVAQLAQDVSINLTVVAGGTTTGYTNSTVSICDCLCIHKLPNSPHKPIL